MSSIDTDIMRVTLPLMAKYGVTPNPINYAIWYVYICSHLPQFQESLTNILDIDGASPADCLRSFMNQYIANQETTELQNSEDLLTFLKAAFYHSDLEPAELARIQSEPIRKLAELGSEELEVIIDYMINSGDWTDEDLQVFTVIDSANEEIEELKEEIEKIREAAITDALTKIPNRREFDRVLKSAMQRYNPSEGSLCLLMIDIDHFKQVNDQHGHIVGDQILKFIAQCLKEQLKGRDFIARFGGEEFTVILERTNLQAAIKLAEAIRRIIELQRIQLAKLNEHLPITVSIGAAEFTPADTMDIFIDRADKALYEAKHAGRNCVRPDVK